MNPEKPNLQPERAHFSLLRNWMSLTGLLVVGASFFSALFLLALDLFSHSSNPYVGILTYLVAPMFLVMGLFLTVVGALRERAQLKKALGEVPKMVINLSRPRDRKVLGWFVAGSALFLLISALGSYQTYHFTESTTFCGQACHTVMQPEMVAYQNGAHARVSCTECHIGKGATWYVRSKLSGAYQVYATFANKYPRPVPTPIKNLRPAQETCEQCHWPKAFVGNIERTFTSFLGDQTNSVYTARMLMKVGGADPTHGPVGGIHWHMNVGNRIEYVASDEARQTIPWVRTVSAQGVVTEYRAPNYSNTPPAESIRRMDCMDCHNRPAHILQAPNTAVNLAMALGQIDKTLPHIIDSALPFVKTNAVYALTRPYTNETQAFQQIATHLTAQYPQFKDDPRLGRTIEAVQRIYTNNFFPQMKATWRAYPNNIGHKDWPGCFRCHDGKHKTSDGKGSIKANDCNACHLILTQGSGDELAKLDARGQEFKHPGGDIDAGSLCTDCHNGE